METSKSKTPVKSICCVNVYTATVRAAVTVNQSMCQHRVILMLPLLISLYLALIISALFRLLLILFPYCMWDIQRGG